MKKFVGGCDDKTLSSSSKALKLQKSNTREAPIYACKDEIKEVVDKHPVVIVHGVKGCGKSTFLPKFFYQSGMNKGKMIAVTLPRRTTAIHNAERVARDMGLVLGNEVGYEIRFESLAGSSTKVKFMTDGHLITACVADRDLTEYSIVIVDEAHERVLKTDILLVLLKDLVKRNTNVKVVLTSETNDTEKFSRYFSNAPIVRIAVTEYEVDVSYFDGSYLRRANEIAQKVKEIHSSERSGDILAFLTSLDEVDKCVEELKGIQDLNVLPLYAPLDFTEQQMVAATTEFGRRAIVATNIAEVIIPMDNIRHVVDCGYCKRGVYDPTIGADVWEEEKITKTEANIRRQIAGQSTTGYCYRMYSRSFFESLSEDRLPEISTRDLLEGYLKMVGYGLNPETVEFVDSPPKETILKYKGELVQMELISEFNELTEDGKQVAKFPMEPALGKALMASVRNGCIADVAVILAMLPERNLFKKSSYENEFRDLRHCTFQDRDGDPFILLNLYNAWMRSDKSHLWCLNNSVDVNVLTNVDIAQRQLQKLLEVEVSSTSQFPNKLAIKRSLAAGFFRHICKRTAHRRYYRMSDGQAFLIHPSSGLFERIPDYLLYFTARKSTQLYILGNLALDKSVVEDYCDVQQPC